MNRVELLTVEDTFAITGRGVIVTPSFSVPQRGWHSRGDHVTIVPPSGPEFDTTAQFNLEHFHFRDPSVPVDKRWRVIVLITGATKEQLPIGSRVLVSADVRDALFEGKNA